MSKFIDKFVIIKHFEDFFLQAKSQFVLEYGKKAIETLLGLFN